MRKPSILPPRFKAALLDALLILIFLLTFFPILFFQGLFKLWLRIKDFRKWKPFEPKAKKPIKHTYYTNEFKTVAKSELKAIKKRREFYDLPTAGQGNLWGMCISGGGIRSATIALGLVQTLIKKDLLKKVDYLSTVSGGGYMGSCLTSLMSLEKHYKSDYKALQKLRDKKLQLERLLHDDDLPEEIYTEIKIRINNLEKKIENKEEEFRVIEKETGLIDLDLTPDKNPFVTDKNFQYQTFKNTKFNPKHQMHHLRSHGQYLTPDKGIDNRDVKRAFGAIWTGILHNFMAYFTVVAIVVSIAFTLLFAISNGQFFEAVNYAPVEIIEDESNLSYVIREIKNWYDKGISRQVKHIYHASESHPMIGLLYLLLGVFFSSGYLYFAFAYQRPSVSEEKLNTVTSGSTFRNEQEMEWLNSFRKWSYGIVFLTPLPVVACLIEFHPAFNFAYSYWIVFALPVFFGFGMVAGSFLIMPLMEYSKFIWNPMIKNLGAMLGRRGEKNFRKVGGSLVSFINRRRNSPTFRSFYSAAQGQAMYVFILGFVLPFILLAVFSLRLEGNFIYSLLSLGVVYYFFTSRFGTTSDYLDTFLKRIKMPMLNFSVILIIFITMSVFAGKLIDWHDCVSQTSEINIYNRLGEGVYYDNEPEINDLVFTRNADTVYFTITEFDSSLYQIKFAESPKRSFKIERPPVSEGQVDYSIKVYPTNPSTQSGNTFIRLNDITTDSLIVQISVQETLTKTGFPTWGNGISELRIGSFRFSARSLFAFFLSALGLFVMGHLTNANRLSLHYFYRDRLSETYLVTEGRIRRNNVRSLQGMPLKVLRDHGDLDLHDVNDLNKAPYHLIMAGLDLQGSNDLVRRVMKSEPFLFSQNYVGSISTGYVQTEKFRNGTTTLGTAMTISGAAVSAGMGKLSFAAQAFFMALFNLRTGFWLENPWYYRNSETIKEVEPSKVDVWRRPFWIKYLFYEMFGKTTAKRPYINVADGGFTGDNLGLLPLIQRKCEKIIICDFEEDPDYGFESFMNACRMANIDFNTEIEINLEPLLPDEEEKPFPKSKTSMVRGKVHYPHGREGEILYVKSSIAHLKTSPEDLDFMPVNVFNYKKDFPVFPHESTADQFFNDVQFEAYRALGNHLGYFVVHDMAKWEY